MALKEIEGKCFTFLWTLKNVSFCSQKRDEPIKSPAFVVEEMEKTKWKWYLYPRGISDGNYISYYLRREEDSKGPSETQIKLELAFVSENDSVLKSEKALPFSCSRGGYVGYPRFANRENVFISERAAFLTKDTLTLRCRIWKSVGEMQEECRCSAHTHIGVEKRSFLWQVKNFSTLELEKNYAYEIKSVDDELPLMTLGLSLTGGLSTKEIIRFKLSPRNKTVNFSSLKLSLIDASGSNIECNHDEFWFECIDTCKQLAFFFTKKKLLENKSIYLPDDTLSLHWDCAFSKGIVLEEIEEVQSGFNSLKINVPHHQHVNNEMAMPLSHTFIGNLKSLYDDNHFCDVKLKTSTEKVFPAHKIILSASSPVFKAMFESDMKEKDSDCVKIDDLNDDSIHRMLLYVYTNRMEDPTWESASNLYLAADKYDIQNLKKICSSYLKDNLSQSNACEILLLADLHADHHLKSAVQDYILKHDKDIINSDEWKFLMETNGKLAAETACLRYK